MDPKFMEVAMEQMKKMSPEQMQQMMRNMPNMSPAMMSTAMEQMKSMKNDDWERTKEQMKNMDPSQLAQQAQQVNTQMKAQTEYALKASVQLKTEGNSLHNAQKYEEAAEKYRKAKSNVTGMKDEQAIELQKACSLNLSSCYLNLKVYDKCLLECNEVLSSDPKNLKALYRRGEAFIGLQQWKKAVIDLSKAAKMPSGQQDTIKQRLQFAEEKLESVKSETPDEEEEIVIDATNTASSSSTSSSFAPMSTPDPVALKMGAEMLQTNPEIATQIASMIDTMTPEQLDQLNAASGQKITMEQLKAQKEVLAKMDPQTMRMMADMSKSVPMDLREKLAKDPQAAAAEAAKLLAQNPDMAKAASEMISNMPPEQLQNLAAQSGMTGMNLTPEMAKMAADMMSKMTPDDMAEMSKMAAAMQMPGAGMAAASTASSSSAASSSVARQAGDAGPSGSMPAMPPGFGGFPMPPMGGMGGMDQMAKMMENPAVVNMAAEMMKNMDQSTLTDMLMRGGMWDKTEAEAAAAQMKNINPNHLQWLVKVMMFVQRMMMMAKQARDMVTSNYLLLAGIVLLLLALVLRLFKIL